MLLMLIAVPAIYIAAFGHALFQTYAPSNILIRHVRASRPTVRRALALGALAVACAAAARLLTWAINAGGPGWLNVVVLSFGWNAIKFLWAAAMCPVWNLINRVRSTSDVEG